MVALIKSRYLSILRVVFVLLILRIVIALDLLSFKNVFSSLVAILFILLCRQIVEYVIRVRKLCKLPGPPLRQGIRILLAVMLESRRRGYPLAVIANEVSRSLPRVGYERGEHLFTFVSWLKATVHLRSPEAMREVINHPHAQSKGPSYSGLAIAIGNGLNSLNGDKWLAHRKLLTPAFHFKILNSALSIVVPQAESLVSRLEEDASRKVDRSIDDILPYILDSTMNVLMRSAMNLETHDNKNITILKKNASDVIELSIAIVINPLMVIDAHLGLSEKGKKFKQFHRAMLGLVNEVISKRMVTLKERQREVNNNMTEEEMVARSKEKEPFIDIMIHEHLRDPQAMPLDDMCDETRTFTGAGADSTAWSICYSLLLLGHHSEVQEKLYQELQVFFSKHDFDQLTPEIMNRMTYLNAVFNETLRIYPPFGTFARIADEDITIQGELIPKGTEIMLPVIDVHMNPRYWPDPHRFKPERFINHTPEPYTFLPFSAGARNCIAQKYAAIQAKATIIRIVSKFKIQSITQLDEVTVYAGPVARSAVPIKLRFDAR